MTLSGKRNKIIKNEINPSRSFWTKYFKYIYKSRISPSQTQHTSDQTNFPPRWKPMLTRIHHRKTNAACGGSVGDTLKQKTEIRNNKFPIKRSARSTNNLQPSQPIRIHPSTFLAHPQLDDMLSRIITNAIWRTQHPQSSSKHFTQAKQRFSSRENVNFVNITQTNH